MNKSAYQKIQSLHQRIARLEHQARHRDIVTRKGRKSLSQLWDLAEEFNSLAQNKGFLRSKVTEKDDLPVVVLKNNMFVFFEPLGYHFEADGSSRKYMDWGNLVNRLNMEGGSFGNEEAMMEDYEIMPSTDEVLSMLQGARQGEGYMGERWTIASDDGKRASFVTASGTADLAVVLTKKGIKFSLTAPFVRPNQPMATLKGFIREEGREMQLNMLGLKLDEVAQKAGKRFGKSRLKILKEMGV